MYVTVSPAVELFPRQLFVCQRTQSFLFAPGRECCEPLQQLLFGDASTESLLFGELA